jgi:hypothetical protein
MNDRRFFNPYAQIDGDLMSYPILARIMHLVDDRGL